MKLLILGGTIFLGRHLVEVALARRHEVTLFNRGEHSPELFPDCEKLRGDRDSDLSPIRGRTWDAVIDTCGYIPRIVRKSAEALTDSVDHYTFISSISVYSDFSRPGLDESGPMGRLVDPTVETVDAESYGPLKVLCEEVVEEAFPGRWLSIRAGLIVGPHDVSDRFTYWPHRIAQGGEVLAPGDPTEPVQYIDVRDLAEWTIRMIELRGEGAYNATGPADPMPMGVLLDECRSLSGADSDLVWLSEPFLLEQGVEPWSDLPLWVPTATDPAYAGFSRIDCRKAIRAGLTFRPAAQTVRDTLDWDRTRPEDYAFRAGITREREAELIRAWHSSAHAAG